MTLKARDAVYKLPEYVPGKSVQEVQQEFGLDHVIKLASNENPLGPSSKAVKALISAVQTINIYPDGKAGLLREKLADFYGMKEQEIVLGNGSDELIHLLTFAFLRTGDEVLIAHPSFAMYKISVEAAGARAVRVELDSDLKIDLNALSEALTSKTRMVILCNPNNPTGLILHKQEVNDFLSKLPDDVLTVFDEAYYEFVEDTDYADGLSFLKNGINCVILRTFSKVYGLAGLRIGYMLAKQEICSVMERVRSPFNVNSLAQKAAAAALDDQEHVKKVLFNNHEQKCYLYEELARMKLTWLPSESNFIFIDISSTGLSGKDIFNSLLRRGVIIRTGFDKPDWIRVTVGLPEENSLFIKELGRLLKNG